MLGRYQLHSLILTVLAALCFAFGAPARAAETPADAPITAPVQTTVIAEIDSSVVITLDGETLEDTRLHRGADGEIYVDALPIFETLGNDVEFDAETNALIVRRSQDGVVMELYTDTGLVKADGQALGHLETFGTVSTAEMILTPNAVAVLSGASGNLDNENNSLDFELDARLRTTTGFDLLVNGVPLGNVSPEPRSVGPVLLLPLRPIARELGHVLDVVEDGRAVRVERSQDSAILTLELDTGLVSLYGNAIGFSEDASFIDAQDLLLPVSAVEALTGTNITAGDDGAVLINLDDRLTNSIAPDGTVEEVAADTPFAVEYAAFELGPASVNRVEVGAHSGTLNGRLRLEVGEIPNQFAELEPDWVSAEFEHVSGLTGSIGDNAADLRQLDGVGVRRFRGIAVEKDADAGRWAFAAGTPAADRRRVGDDQTRLNFKGLAAGARYASQDGWEAGLSVRHDPVTEDQMAVLNAISGSLGRKKGAKTSWDASGSLGVFNGANRASPVDIRARAQVRHELSDNVRLNAFTSYTGQEFTRNLLREEDLRKLNALAQGVDADDADNRIPDPRTLNADAAEVGVTVAAYTGFDTGPLSSLSASLSARHDRAGLITGTDQAVGTTSISGSLGTVIRPLDLSLNLGGSVYHTDKASEFEPETGYAASVGAYRSFGRVTARAQAQVVGDELSTPTHSGSLTLDAGSFNVGLPKDASLSLRPSATAAFRQDVWTMQGGLYANVDSGSVFGRKTRVSASLGIVQSATAQAGTRTNQFLNVSVARKVRIGRNMSVGLGYRADLRGRHTLGLLLSGRYDFNPKRRLVKTEDNAGLLQGVAFLDENGDGVQQDGERGAGGVIVRIQGSPHALRTDPSGAYTVQNIRRGLYQVGIDNRSLPLGYAMADGATVSATIRPGHVTTLALPIQRYGQLRGSVYVDADASGAFERGEERPEGVTLELLDAEGEVADVTVTTAFGQFAFDNLPIGEYTLRNRRAKSGPAARTLKIDLSEAANGMARVKLGLLRDPDVLMAEGPDDGTPKPETDPPPTQPTALPPP